MHRGLTVCLSAAALVALTALSGALAQETTPTTTAPTTTTSPPQIPTSTTATTTAQRTTTTTAKSAATTTTRANGGRPVPPPASGAQQPLVPDLLGTPVTIATTTSTLVTFAPRPLSTVPTETRRAAPIAAHEDAPTGATLILATIAWLASLGGLLVYVEDQRSRRWRHLAR